MSGDFGTVCCYLR